MLQEVLGSVGGGAHTIIAFLIAVGVLVFIHEFGHFYIARRNGVKVETFSIGFGKELFGWNDRHGTHWRIALLPLGGYVKMYGDVDPASAGPVDTEAAKQMTAEQRNQAFFAKSVGQRAAIVFAGPAINFIFAFLLFVGLFMTVGRQYAPPVVGGLAEDMPAAQAGVQIGDRILSVAGQDVERFQDIAQVIELHAKEGTPIDLRVDRNGTELQFTIMPKLIETENNLGKKHMRPRMGVISTGQFEYLKMSPLAALGGAASEIWSIVTGSLTGLSQIIMGERDSRELSGVLTIAKISGDMAHAVVPYIYFLAFLSVSLGLINLFPIPVLDGGHLVFYAIEALRGRPLSDNAQEYSLRFGVAVVLSLTVFALWNDLNNLGVVVYIKNLFT
jgi:regulator of sigma E protease